MPTFVVITKSDVMGIPVEIFECFLISSSFRPQKIPLELHSVYSTDTSSDHATCRRGKRGTMRPVKIFQRTQQRDTRREFRNKFLQKSSMIENHGSKLLTKNFQHEKTLQTSNKTSEKLNDSKSLNTQFAVSVYLLSISDQKKALKGTLI